MPNYVGTNENFIKAYNEYLETNNLTQAKTSQYVNIAGNVFPVDYDMFFDFLINKIVISTVTQHEFTDPLSFLYSDGLGVGAVIEDKRTVLLGVDNEYSTQEFVTDVTNPFIKKKAGISVVYHKVNRHKLIKRTVSYDQIKEALLTENGIMSLVDAQIHDISVEKDAWAYRDKKQALESSDYLTFLDYEDYADFNLKVRNAFVDLKNFDNSYKYNASLLYSPTSEKNLLIIMSEKYKNEEDIKFFTGLFNVSYAELKQNIAYIDEFTDPSIKAMIVDRRGLYFKRTLDTVRTLPNPEDLTINYFSHFWRMHSVSPHYSAVAIRKNEAVNAVANIEQAVISKTVPLVVKFTIPNGYSVKYTTDGSNPTTSDTAVEYEADGSIAITSNKVIKVWTYKTPEEGAEAVANKYGHDVKTYRVRFV